MLQSGRSMTVADHIAQWMDERGVAHAFGIVGGGNVALWDAITRWNKTILIPVHHEQAAAMAAAYYFRTRGKLAACICTTGAGSANAITGVLAAHMDSIPLLVLSGNEAFDSIGSPQRVKGVQGYDSSAVARPITKWSARMMKENWHTTLETGYRTALEHRQGPVWVDIAKDIQTASA